MHTHFCLDDTGEDFIAVLKINWSRWAVFSFLSGCCLFDTVPFQFSTYIELEKTAYTVRINDKYSETDRIGKPYRIT